MVEPGLVPHFEKLCTAKYNVVMSAGLILPEGRESDSVLQTATSLASERERERGKRGAEQERGSRRNEDDLCPAMQMQK